MVKAGLLLLLISLFGLGCGVDLNPPPQPMEGSWEAQRTIWIPDLSDSVRVRYELELKSGSEGAYRQYLNGSFTAGAYGTWVLRAPDSISFQVTNCTKAFLGAQVSVTCSEDFPEGWILLKWDGTSVYLPDSAHGAWVFRRQ